MRAISLSSILIEYSGRRFFCDTNEKDWRARLTEIAELIAKKYSVRQLSLYDGTGKLAYDGKSGELDIEIQ